MGKQKRHASLKTKEYILHLLAEISSYVLEGDPLRMVISLHQEPDGVHLCVLDSTERDSRELERIRLALNPQARPELADYYGHMAGGDLIGAARLSLVGWQVKHADVESTQDGTKINIWLGNESFEPKARK